MITIMIPTRSPTDSLTHARTQHHHHHRSHCYVCDFFLRDELNVWMEMCAMNKQRHEERCK